MSDTSGASAPTPTPSNPYQGGGQGQGGQGLVVVGQNVVQAINNLAQVTSSATNMLSNLLGSSIVNVFRPATASSSPITTPVNNIGTTAISVLPANLNRHGLIFHNPATTNINIYVFQSTIATAPSLSSLGGAFLIIPGASLPFPAVEYANINTAFSAFASNGTTNALTIVEFL